MNYIKTILFVLFVCANVTASALSLGDRLNQVIDGVVDQENEILDPEVAFLFSSDVINGNEVRFTWQIEKGYYLYQNRFAVESKTKGLEIGQINLPEGKEKDDPTFGMVVTYTGNTSISVSLIRDNAASETVQILVKYQGCKEDSVCYPPQEKIVDLVLPVAGNNNVEFSASNQQPQKISEQDAILQKLSEGSFVANIVVFFIFGLLLSLTPCVFPMIPILSGIIVGQGKQITTRRAFVLSLTYVLAMAITYALLGILAGSFEFNLQSASQNIWVITAFSLIFIMLALSMFGFYELQLPGAIQTQLNKLSDQQQVGSIHGTAMMGILSAIIVGPCVAPPLAGALLYISQSGDAILGGLALFAMGLGLGVPLLIIGTSAGKLLPRAGAWMAIVKAIFGVILLGVAIWFLERVLPGAITLLLWSCLLIVSAVYMGALDKLDGGSRWLYLWKGLGLVLLVYGMILIVAATLGGTDPLRPFKSLSFNDLSENQTSELAFKTIKSLDDLNKELQQASLEGKTVMLDFYADWCIVCKEMEVYTFSDKAVQASLKEVILLKADVTANDSIDKALLAHFNLFGPPAILFFNDQATEQKGYRLVGFVEANDFITHINEAKAL